MQKLLFFIISFYFVLAYTPVIAEEYFMAINGSDTNPGTQSRPWKSLQKAIWKIKAGDTLIIRGGVYHDASFADIAIASKGKLTTIRSAKGEKVVFDGRISSGDALMGKWFKISPNRWKTQISSQWKRLNGMWIKDSFIPLVSDLKNLKPSTWYFAKDSMEAITELGDDKDPNDSTIEFRLHSMIEVDTPYWLISGIAAQYYNYAGIVISNTHHVSVKNCEVYRNGGSGIEADEATDLLIEKNHASFNGADGGPGWASGIHLWKTTSMKNIVRDNLSHNNWDPSNHHTDGNGIAIDRGGKDGGAQVYNNTVHSNGGRGIDITEVSNVKLHDNLLYNNSLDSEIANQGELSIAESISTSGLDVSRNTIRAKNKNPPVVLFGNIEIKAIGGDKNIFCNSNSPNLAVAIYGKRSFSLLEWQKLTGRQINSSQDCSEDNRRY